jgi:HPt (histidine-containing phosphotransfer) domain-containing protein
VGDGIGTVFSGDAAGVQYPSAMPQPVIDPQAIENLRMLNPDDGDAFLREIAEIFVSDTPKRLAELDQTLASGDAVAFVRAAHSIKGSSSNLGALALRQAAESLENQAKKDGLGNVTGLIAQVRGEFTKAQQELGKLVKLA